jgi:transcriptional regulator with XRE-family HTH domain
MDWAAFTSETRRRLRKTQAEMAAELGVDTTTLSRWERGVVAPRPSQQRALSQYSEAPLISRAAFDHFVGNSFQMIIVMDAENTVFAASDLARYVVEQRIDGSMIGRHINEFFNVEVLEILREVHKIDCVTDIPYRHALYCGNGQTSALYMVMRYFIDDKGIVTAIIGFDRQRNSDAPFARLVDLVTDSTFRDRIWMASYAPWLLPHEKEKATAPNL